MKTLIKFCTVIITLIIAVIIFFSCEKKKININGSIEFSIKVNSNQLKGTTCHDLDDAELVVISIEKSDGSLTEYTSSELKLYKLGDNYITEKIVLPEGSYQLTEFYLLNSENNIIFACPLEASVLAQNVNDPLPVLFNVTGGESNPVEVEVLSTEKLTPDDFGLINFPINYVETFQFLISVSELGTDNLLIADLKVTSGSYTYTQDLDAVIDNIVTIKDGYDDYTISVEKEGYERYQNKFTNEELKSYASSPLIIELVPLEELTVIDYDGNVYKAVQIGEQIWMAENLKVTHYNNGNLIPNITDSIEWINLTTGARCYYKNDSTTYNATYGALYNGYTVVDCNNLCPTGWHVPSDDEWKEMEMYLGMSQIEANKTGSRGTNQGGKMKEIGTIHWLTPNYGATNESGFTGLPGGYHKYDGIFWGIKYRGIYWSSSNDKCTNPYIRILFALSEHIYRNYGNRQDGYSVRCIKD